MHISPGCLQAVSCPLLTCWEAASALRHAAAQPEDTGTHLASDGHEQASWFHCKHHWFR